MKQIEYLQEILFETDLENEKLKYDNKKLQAQLAASKLVSKKLAESIDEMLPELRKLNEFKVNMKMLAKNDEELTEKIEFFLG